MGSLYEGGVAGHMSHLYDNPELTFEKIKEILRDASQGNLVGTEKTDGQNLFLSYNIHDGFARAARNKGDIKNGGMTASELAAKFGGRGALEEAFNDAFAAFEQVVGQMSEEEQAEIFGQNTNIYYNAEIQDPRNPNVINYDMKTLTIHRVGHGEFDRDTGAKTNLDVSENAEKLTSALESYQGERQVGQYRVQMNAIRNLEKLADDTALQSAVAYIDDLMNKAEVSGDSTIGEYVLKEAKKEISERVDLTPEQMQLMMTEMQKRMYNMKGKALRGVLASIDDPEVKQEVRQILTRDYKQIYKHAILPLESIVHDFSVEMLKGLQSAFILDNVKEVSRLRGQVGRAIQAIENSGSEDAMEILKKQMEKLKSIENVTTAAEGFVFNYDGQAYKFTGNFAPMNQLLGLFKYGRGNIPAMQNLQEEEGSGRRSLALVPGAFRPPHLGHLEMVRHYAGLADDVFVLISNPKSEKSKRRIGDREVKLAHSGDLWRNLTQGMEGVQIFDPEDAPPSPLTAVTRVISDPEIAEKYDTIYLGASEKGGDDKRFNYIIKHAHPDVQIVNQPAPVTNLPGEYKTALEETGYLEKMPSTAKGKDPQNYHASDLRFLLQNACGDDNARRLAEFYVGKGNVDLYLTTCEVAGGNKMEITESRLLEIIKEETELVLEEASSQEAEEAAMFRRRQETKNFLQDKFEGIDFSNVYREESVNVALMQLFVLMQTELKRSIAQKYFGKKFMRWAEGYIKRAAEAGYENILKDENGVMTFLTSWLHQNPRLNEALSKSDLNKELGMEESLSLPSAIARISSLLDPYLDAPVDQNEDGSEEYRNPEVSEQAIEALSKVIDLIQNAFLNMMSGDPMQEEAKKMKCPRCGHVNEASDDKCSNCELPMGEEWEGKPWQEVE